MRASVRMRKFHIATNPIPSHTKNPQTQTHKNPNKPLNITDDTKNIVQCNMSITSHMRSGNYEAALRVFNDMPRRTVVSYNAMVSGYLSNLRFDLARDLFDKMPERDLVSWNVIISGYVRNKDLGSALRVFNDMSRRSVVSHNAMMSGFLSNHRFDLARELFEKMPQRDLVSWNVMISGHVRNKDLDAARELFDRMPERDIVSWNAMLSGYVQHGMLERAREVFDQMPEKDPISWNVMIAGYAQGKRMDVARELFEAMPSRNISSWNTMLTGYAQSGDVARAKSIFDGMRRRDSISWAAMIAGYAQNGYAKEALRLFVEMQREGERLRISSYMCALSTCAEIAALELGKQLHGRLVKSGFETGCFLLNALLVMYSKCGSIEEAYDVFRGMRNKDIVSFNTMISGFARHGLGKEALREFDSMMEVGITPDEVTLVGVLSACSHTGLVEKGMKYFHSMSRDYRITPNSKHYTCMIDLLGRAGRLDEAQDLLRAMPFEPKAATWGALLGASRIHGNTELGEKAAKIVFELEPKNTGMYVLLSNLYAASGRWSDVRGMRTRMRDSGLKNVPGCSWVEVRNKVKTFRSVTLHIRRRARSK